MDEPRSHHRETDELAVLDALESDLVAVEQAIESLDRVSSEVDGGECGAGEMTAIVSPQRFSVAEADLS